MGALDGLRVLELAGGVGVAYAAKLLADLGADVLRVETEQDVVRGRLTMCTVGSTPTSGQ